MLNLSENIRVLAVVVETAKAKIGRVNYILMVGIDM